jgi:hypothetical protein
VESEGEDCRQGGTQPPRLDPATPGGADRVYSTVCRDDSTRLGEEAQATPIRPSYRGRDEGHHSEADGSFAGEVEGAEFQLHKAALIGSVKAVWKTLNSSS